MEQKTWLTTEFNEEELANGTGGFLDALRHSFNESSLSRSSTSTSRHTAEPPPTTKNTDEVSHQIPRELSEQEMQTVNGGVDIHEIHEIPHLGRVTSTGSSVSSSASSLAEERAAGGVTDKKSALTHPVSQAFAAGVGAVLAVKGIHYAV